MNFHLPKGRALAFSRWLNLRLPVPLRMDVSHFYSATTIARVYKKWHIPGIYQKKRLPHQEAGFFRYMGDELKYPNFNLPHQYIDRWEMIWDILFHG